MNLIPTIRTLTEKKLVGQRMTMSLIQNRTGELWRNFMPRRKEILKTVGLDLISMQVYRPEHFRNFSPSNEFEKWSAVEVNEFENVPQDMETFILEPGLYAVFNYKGSSNDPTIFQYIFQSWLPNSAYILDERPHFEVLGEKYKNNDPESEEEICIPVRQKNKSRQKI